MHVSGHPSKNELKKMYEWLAPDTLIPVHGEFKHMTEHANYAEQCGIKNQIIVENGSVVLLNKKNPKIINKVKSGRCVLKGKKILPVNNRFFDNLKIVSTEGEFFLVLIFDVNDNLVGEPIIFCPTVSDDELFKNEIKSVIQQQVIEIVNKSIVDDFLISELKKIIKSFIKKNIGLKPITHVEIVRI